MIGFELLAEVLDGAVDDDVGELEHVRLALVERCDVRGPVASQARRNLVHGQIKVHLEHLIELSSMQVPVHRRIVRGDLAGVRPPKGILRVERGRVTGDRGVDEGDRDVDVLMEQVRELVGKLVPVESFERLADVVLIPLESTEHREQVPQDRVRYTADDEVARPADMLLPELALRSTES